MAGGKTIKICGAGVAALPGLSVGRVRSRRGWRRRRGREGSRTAGSGRPEEPGCRSAGPGAECPGRAFPAPALGIRCVHLCRGFREPLVMEPCFMLEMKRNGVSAKRAVAVSSGSQVLLCLDQLVTMLAMMQRW